MRTLFLLLFAFATAGQAFAAGPAGDQRARRISMETGDRRAGGVRAGGSTPRCC